VCENWPDLDIMTFLFIYIPKTCSAPSEVYKAKTNTITPSKQC